MVGWLVLAAGRAGAQQRADHAEYEVKSAYLVNFLQYASWPAAALGPGDELRICILGDDPMGDLLPRAVGSRRINGHAVRLVSVVRPVEADRCHAAFIAARNSTSPEAWLARVRERPVLTIGEGEEFAQAGGIIALVFEGRTVRFEVNARAIQRAGLQLSSRVLRLAARVHDE